MKKIIISLLIVILSLSVIACGGEADTSDTSASTTQTQSAAPEGMTSSLPGAGMTEEKQTEEAPETDKTVAESFIDQEVDLLYKAIGEPVSSEYADSCMGSGEDGELYYDGFTVYTHREGDSEIVQKVD